MPPLGVLLRSVLGTENSRYECRNCGTSLDEAVEQCPACGETDIATYQLR